MWSGKRESIGSRNSQEQCFCNYCHQPRAWVDGGLVAQIKASPWPDVPVHAGRLRSPVLQEGDDWYAIDVTEPEMSGPSDPDLYNMPMVPKGPGRIDSAAEDVSSAEGQSIAAYDPKAQSTGLEVQVACAWVTKCRTERVRAWGGGGGREVLLACVHVCDYVGDRFGGLNLLAGVRGGNAAVWPL